MLNRNRQRKIGLLLSYVMLMLDTLISIIFTPLLLGSLGDNQYGLYQLMGSMISYLAIMDLGLGGTITRYLVKYRTEKNEHGAQNFFAHALIVYAALCFLIAIAGIIIMFLIGKIYQGLTVEEVSEAKTLFIFLLANLILTMYDHVFSGVLIADEQFIVENSIKIGRVIARSILIAVLLQFYQNAIVIVATEFVLTLSTLTIRIIISLRKVKIRARLYYWDTVLFREVFAFTMAIFLQSIINQFNNNVDKTVLGIYSTTAVVAIYSIAMQLFSAYNGLSTAVQSIYTPKISKIVFEGKSNCEITDAIVVPSRIQFTILSAVCIGFWAYGKEFVNLWCGKDEAWIIAAIIMTAGLVELFQNTTTCVLKAKNVMLGRTLINLATTAINFIITLVLVPRYGMLGAAWGTVFSLVVGYVIINNIYYRIRVGIDVKHFFAGVFKGLLPAALIGGAIGVIPRFVIIEQSWFHLSIKLLLFCSAYIVCIYCIGLNVEERYKVWKMSRFRKGQIAMRRTL